MAELRDSYNFSYNREIDYAIGKAIQSLGPEVVLGVIQLQSTKGEIDIKRDWLLPILEEYTSHSTLEFFINHLLPLAKSSE